MVYRRLKELREDHDLTQKEIGTLIGIPQRTYSHYESGSHEIPLGVLIKLAKIYHVSADYILELSDEK